MTTYLTNFSSKKDANVEVDKLRKQGISVKVVRNKNGSWNIVSTQVKQQIRSTISPVTTGGIQISNANPVTPVSYTTGILRENSIDLQPKLYYNVSQDNLQASFNDEYESEKVSI